MRRNTKLAFTQKQDRPPLSAAEARYWKSFLGKICKIGFEHEFNLQESRGTCEGNTYACPCSNPKKEEEKCNEQCMRKSTCELLKKYECPGIYCIHFQSPCTTCADSVRDCEKCHLFNDPAKQPANARKNIMYQLRPTKSLADPGQHGTYEVVEDGSLLGGGGVEVTTVGRRVNYDTFLKQATKISEECVKYGAYLNERTSIHMHLVAGYFDISTSQDGKVTIKYDKRGRNGMPKSTIQEMEEPMPEIILANFHQLLRRYHNSITWMTSAGDSKEHLTRWVKFRKPLLKYSALRTNMSRLVRQISENIDSSGKYAFMSYYNCRFDRNGRVDRFHVEGRYCDGLLSPTAIASLGILLYAMLMKAVSLSQYGILNSGTPEYMEQAYTIQELLMNNDGAYQGPRTSDTSRFEPYMETVRKQSEEMVTLLSSELRHHGRAFEALQMLADKPCSMRLIDGDSWEKIEADLSGQRRKKSAEEEQILEAVDTFYIDDCVDTNEWLEALSEDTGTKMDKLRKTAEELAEHRIILWDSVVGTYVRC